MILHPKFCYRAILFALAAVLIGGCAPIFSLRASPSPAPASGPSGDPIAALIDTAPAEKGPNGALTKMGYAIQVGAFANLDNAVRLERRLDARGIDAYYFRHVSGLYKVRFGNHASLPGCPRRSRTIAAAGLIGHFFIVIPQDYAAARIQKTGRGDLRAELVQTARSFLGVPYRWGGTDREDGFDCSGLTMVCYRLNGLNLPRVSRSQFRKGRFGAPRPIFARATWSFSPPTAADGSPTSASTSADGRFIHAPRTGKTVRVAHLSNPYFKRTYVGARSYF